MYVFHQVRELSREAARVREAIVSGVNHVREAGLSAGEADHQRLEALRAEVDGAKHETAVAAARAKREVQRRAEQLAGLLIAERRRHQQELSGELTNIRAVTVAAREVIGELNSEIAAKKSDAARTRSNLENTAAEVDGLSGDVRHWGGRAVANQRDLAALRGLRDRRYYEFELTRSAAPRQIAEVTVLLRKADPRRNTYTIELINRDHKVEQKDRGINEPVRFYVSGARQPYELVVNEIGKDLVKGYLAAPRTAEIAAN